MNPIADKPVTSGMHLRGAEMIGSVDEEHARQEISRDDIARLALSMHEHRYYFTRRRGLKIRFSRDLNGSGIQGLDIYRADDQSGNSNLIQVIFRHSYGNDSAFLYEADLIMDQRKDYEPTVNKGKHRFVADRADMQIEWNSDEARQWRSDIDRISRSHDTLNGWIASGSDMLVSCGGYFCFGSAVLTSSDLSQHVAAGLNLEDLKARLRCSKCGKRAASVMTF
jgi:hypothetical protein